MVSVWLFTALISREKLPNSSVEKKFVKTHWFRLLWLLTTLISQEKLNNFFRRKNRGNTLEVCLWWWQHCDLRFVLDFGYLVVLHTLSKAFWRNIHKKVKRSKIFGRMRQSQVWLIQVLQKDRKVTKTAKMLILLFVKKTESNTNRVSIWHIDLSVTWAWILY